MRFLKELQTPKARRDKYAFCRAMGKNLSWARAMRDWHWTRIFSTLGIPEAEQPEVEEDFRPDYAEVARFEIAEKRGGLTKNG